MPRKADEHLEGRIVNAAYGLWSKGGEPALTMRAVARSAHTTTPTLYQRFRDKHDLLELLQDKAREKMYAAIKPARSAREACGRMLEFMLAHENECRLLAVNMGARLSRKEPMPTYELMQALLAEESRATRRDRARLAFALVAAVHGTALLLLGAGTDARILSDLKGASLEACDALVKNARKNTVHLRKQ